MPVQTMLISKYNPPIKPLGHNGYLSRRCILASVIVLVMAACFGFLLGWLFAKGAYVGLAEDSSRNRSGTVHDLGRDLDPAIAEALIKEVKAESIEYNLRWLTNRDRVAGTEMDLKQAEILRQLWLTYGLDNAGIEAYPALLSYPGNHSDPNRVEVVDRNGTVTYHSRSTEKPVSVQEDPDGVTLPYFAYSRPGIVEGDLIYANYGNDSDYEFLMSTYAINISGKIVLTRSGITSRFSKVDTATKYGAAGLLIFPNMAQNAPEGRAATYPETWWLPGDATERGAMYSISGDPLTPGYPAKEYSSHRSREDVEKHVLTPIPVQPISADGAIALLEQLSEDTPTGPDQWFDWQRGWVDTNQLKFLGGKQRDGRKVRLIVNNRLETKNVYNVFGIVKGAIEPDRLVMLGNHRDAWGRGAIDPGGGTATMMEVSRAVGVLIKQHGWRPRRTIIFASWGAEEFGLIGSTEWVEEKLMVLNHKAVAYLNLDVVVTGRGPAVAKASSSLFETIFKVSTKVPHPKFKSLYEAWANQSIRFWPLQPNSDFKPFFYLAGVPSLTVTCTDRESLYPFYPTYHTEYDVFDYVKHHVDPTFEYHQLIGRLHGQMLLLLADSLVLPLDPTPGSVQMEKEFAYLQSHLSRYNWFQTLQGSNIIGQLDYCIHNFSVDARHLRERTKHVDKTNPYAVRQINDQLMFVERAFINLRWNQDKNDPIFHHVLQSPGTSNCLVVDGFPGIKDFLCDPEMQRPLQQQELPPAALRRIMKEVAALCYALHSATDMMNV